MTSNLLHRAAVLGLILSTAAGCAQAAGHGPVFGDWRGTQPGGSTDYYKTVELVLNGAPNAQSGRYRIATTEQNPGSLENNGTRRWGDVWTSEQQQVDGHTVMIIHLHNTLPGDINKYALESDGALHIVGPNGHVDHSSAGKLYTLRPVPHGKRFGRD
jgi:hypothetical protein